MRIQRLEILRNFFGHRPDLPYNLYVKFQGTEVELKELQEKIIGFCAGGEKKNGC